MNLLLNNSNTNDNEHKIYVCLIESPLGKLISAADDDYIYLITFEDSKNLEKMFKLLQKEFSCSYVDGKNKVLQQLEEELLSYFKGKLRKFTIPMKMIGSDFQKVTKKYCDNNTKFYFKKHQFFY